MGDKFTNFMGPVISRSAFGRVSRYIARLSEAQRDQVANSYGSTAINARLRCRATTVQLQIAGVRNQR